MAHSGALYIFQQQRGPPTSGVLVIALFPPFGHFVRMCRASCLLYC